MSIELTEEQQTACFMIQTWFEEGLKPSFKLGGYAGTGKTTLLKALRQKLHDARASTRVAAFTGKAVNVLQRKGIGDATTIHSLIYEVEIGVGGVLNFHLRSKQDVQADLIIIDEASMISTELYEDLCSFGIPLLFVGDPGQLEPVGDNPNLMAQPDFVLNKIHRQAESSPIITFANDVRRGIKITTQKKDGLTVRDKQLSWREVLAHDQVICAKNATRKMLNEKYRRLQGNPTDRIVPDDKIIVLRNNQNLGVFNGMLLFVDSIIEEQNSHWIVNAHDEVDRKFSRLPIWKEPFSKEVGTTPTLPRVKDNIQVVWCDFGYAITCHKSQGSEWDKVLVWHEFMPPHIWDMKRWSYTAITRAAKELTYCL